MNEKCDVFAKLADNKRILIGTLSKSDDEVWNYQIIKQLVQIEFQFRSTKHYKKS